MLTARCGSRRPSRDQLGKVLAFDVLHRDVEIPVAIADVEDLRDAPARLAFGELVLQNGAAALGGDNIDTVLIAARIDQLQADLPVQHRIVSEEDSAHTAAGELANDLIAAEEFRVHGYVSADHRGFLC